MWQVHESNPSSKLKTTDNIERKTENTLNTPNDLDLPIAIRKGTRKCTKQPLYPLSNCFALDRYC